MVSTQDEFLPALFQLISVRTGLQIRSQDQTNISKKIITRRQTLKLSNLSQYHSLLEGSSSQSDREWQELVVLLTTGESYLFRDQGQINLLRNKILPEIISYQRNLKIQQGKPKAALKVWSAGCSTGEEAYSLAILVNELLPRQDDWNITILGTDINPEAIKKAQQGIYSSWSFRMVSTELQKQHFSPIKSGWEIDAKIRQMVKFSTGNLIRDKLPNSLSNLCDLDLILCRNVFIYFDATAIATVLTKFHNSLRPGGYLITGHAELYNQELSQFHAQILPESIIYQRPIPASLQANQPEQSWPLPSPETTFQRSPASPLPEKTQVALYQAALRQAEKLVEEGAYMFALQATNQAIKHDPSSFDAYYLAAQAYANLGQYQKAQDCCQQAMNLKASSVKPYYLLAKIAEEQGDIELAKSILRKIIYLDPKAIAAYLDLGAIYNRESDIIRAKKMRNTALELLRQVSPHTTIEYQEQLTASELILYIKKLLHQA
ncbi:MAG: tetratricopeptide repeat protein [Trichocoleus desertorum ATA4-8-CV12]|jgi:chemotaxis protein methyltransferase CheR|nr:tetratricopeptide repeat protein [Trichocoleus desertorum ATA4-8-CV12]